MPVEWGRRKSQTHAEGQINLQCTWLLATMYSLMINSGRQPHLSLFCRKTNKQTKHPQKETKPTFNFTDNNKNNPTFSC